jgi:hypothetical protein
MAAAKSIGWLDSRRTGSETLAIPAAVPDKASW